MYHDVYLSVNLQGFIYHLVNGVDRTDVHTDQGCLPTRGLDLFDCLPARLLRARRHDNPVRLLPQKRMAMAAPIPWPEPVTIATLFCSLLFPIIFPSDLPRNSV